MLTKPSELSLLKFKKIYQNLTNYLSVAGKAEESDAVKILILLNLIGEEASELYNTFKLKTDKSTSLLNKFVLKSKDFYFEIETKHLPILFIIS